MTISPSSNLQRLLDLSTDFEKSVKSTKDQDVTKVFLRSINDSDRENHFEAKQTGLRGILATVQRFITRLRDKNSYDIVSNLYQIQELVNQCKGEPLKDEQAEKLNSFIENLEQIKKHVAEKSKNREKARLLKDISFDRFAPQKAEIPKALEARANKTLYKDFVNNLDLLTDNLEVVEKTYEHLLEHPENLEANIKELRTFAYEAGVSVTVLSKNIDQDERFTESEKKQLKKELDETGQQALSILDMLDHAVEALPKEPLPEDHPEVKEREITQITTSSSTLKAVAGVVSEVGLSALFSIFAGNRDPRIIALASVAPFAINYVGSKLAQKTLPTETYAAIQSYIKPVSQVVSVLLLQYYVRPPEPTNVAYTVTTRPQAVSSLPEAHNATQDICPVGDAPLFQPNPLTNQAQEPIFQNVTQPNPPFLRQEPIYQNATTPIPEALPQEPLFQKVAEPIVQPPMTQNTTYQNITTPIPAAVSQESVVQKVAEPVADAPFAPPETIAAPPQPKEPSGLSWLISGVNEVATGFWSVAAKRRQQEY